MSRKLLTADDRLRALGHLAHVPAVTAGQFATLLGVGSAQAERELLAAQGRRLVASADLATRVFAEPPACRYRHDPGRPPDEDRCRELSSLFVSRYHAAPVRPVRLFALTDRARHVLGASAEPPNRSHATHDILLADVMIANRGRGRWVYEPQPPGGRAFREAQPDAGLFGRDGRPLVWVEACGAYRWGRVLKLCEYAIGSGVPLEFWQ